MELEGLLASVKEVTERAGRKINDLYQKSADLDVKLKQDQSPVTRADLEANAELLASLPKLLDVPILSEEVAAPNFEVRTAWQRYWLVDPLDGTKEFVSGTEEFTVNVALIESGKPVLGVVHSPATSVTWCGAAGIGAFRFDAGKRQKICVRKSEPGAPLVVVVSRRHGTREITPLITRLRQKFETVITRQIGSSLKFCLLAEGKADLYPRVTPTCEWDTAAAQAVLEAAGGAVLNDNWRPLRYNRSESLVNPSFYAIADQTVDWQRILFDGID